MGQSSSSVEVFYERIFNNLTKLYTKYHFIEDALQDIALDCLESGKTFTSYEHALKFFRRSVINHHIDYVRTSKGFVGIGRAHNIPEEEVLCDWDEADMKTRVMKIMTKYNFGGDAKYAYYSVIRGYSSEEIYNILTEQLRRIQIELNIREIKKIAQKAQVRLGLARNRNDKRMANNRAVNPYSRSSRSHINKFVSSLEK